MAKSSSADLEEDPLADYLLKLGVASETRRHPAIGCGPGCAALLLPLGSFFLAASFRTGTGPGLIAASYSRHRCSSSMFVASSLPPRQLSSLFGP